MPDRHEPQPLRAVTGVTVSPPALDVLTTGGPFRYGHGFVVQVAPRHGALICNIRNEDVPVGDFEAGMDAVVFSDRADISGADSVVLTRNEHIGQPGEPAARVIIKYPIVPAFVPAAALQEDGSTHLHAGTGFGVNEVLDFPMKPDGSYDKRDKTTRMVRRTELRQLSYDGGRLQVTDTKVFASDAPLRAPGSRWALIWPGLTPAVTDGADLLFPMLTTAGDAATWRSEPMSCGVSRWQYRAGAWHPVSYVAVHRSREAASPRIVHGEPMTLLSMEPSLIRDLDGSLLFTARGTGDEFEDHVIRVWRSTDAAESWQLIIEIPQARGQAPITINQAADGSPYLVGTAYGHERGWLRLWPLNAERTGLEDGITVRDGERQFGRTPSGKPWYIDHASGGRLRLADGRWHGILTYRVMDTGEFSLGPPSPQTGLYVEEVTSAGPEAPAWRFEEPR
jgi:hypothetical protein